VSCTVLNTRVEEKISLYGVYYFLTKQTALTVFMSGGIRRPVTVVCFRT